MARTRTIKRAPRKSNRSKNKNYKIPFVPDALQAFIARRFVDIFAFTLGVCGLFTILSLATYTNTDPSWNTATDSLEAQNPTIANLMGHNGAVFSDLFVQTLGAASFIFGLVLCIWAVRIFTRQSISLFPMRIITLVCGVMLASISFGQIPLTGWNPQSFMGGSFGSLTIQKIGTSGQNISPLFGYKTIAILSALLAMPILLFATAAKKSELQAIATSLAFVTISILSTIMNSFIAVKNWIGYYNNDNYAPKPKTNLFKNLESLKIKKSVQANKTKQEPQISNLPEPTNNLASTSAPIQSTQSPTPAAPIEIIKPTQGTNTSKPISDKQQKFALAEGEEWESPPINLLEEVPDNSNIPHLNESALRKNAELLQNVLADFNVEGDITSIHPGPVVTLYELEPAPGTKSSKVISLADDIARSMSAISVRVAVVPGRNVIGIELPNKNRQIVYMQELIASQMFEKTKAHLPLILGKDIGGQPILADLAKMPHLLVAGTTGSGKSVAVNTMILSILYGLSPEKCRFIMIDPKMLELSVYDGIPHLLSPVVTEPGKAVVALKWT
ncbi:MAG: DNA translocase FtsK 4TM domain-containing protein, partial [Bdellovibrionales bacterium]